MRTICTEVYKFDELDDKAKEKAREWWRDLEMRDPTGQEEIWDSLNALLKLVGLEKWDWDRRTRPPLDEGVSGYGQGTKMRWETQEEKFTRISNWVIANQHYAVTNADQWLTMKKAQWPKRKVMCAEQPRWGISDMTGKRAFAWLENNLFAKLRWHKHKGVKEVIDKKTKLTQWRPYTKQELRDLFKYGYRVGAIPECPLTGYCYDNDFLDDLKDSVKSGMCLGDAFRALPEKAQKMADDEMTWRLETEQVDEAILANEYEFTKEGRKA